MFTSDVSEPYETLKRPILNQGDLTDGHGLYQLLQVVLVSFQKNAVDDLTASADRILEITNSSTMKEVSVNEKLQMRPNDITELRHTVTRYFRFRNGRK